jgi:uncharacterized spore protein YtfJ
MSAGFEVFSRVQDAVFARRSFGDPIQQDGVTVIPVATVAGGGGGGEGRKSGEEEGAGGGFGVRVHPSGAFVVRDGQARWVPAVDVNRIVLGGQLVVMFALWTIRSVLRRRRHR